MTYLQRANKDGQNKQPFYYEVPEKMSEKDYVKCLCVSLTPDTESIGYYFLTRGFFNPYIKITQKEFETALEQAKKKLNL